MGKTESSPIEVSQLDGARIAMTELDAEGSDEVVLIQNLGTVAQPLTGWVLTSLRGETFFTLPEGTILPPGGQLRVHSGPGASAGGPDDLLWTRESVWNNKGDTAVLFGANGHEIARIGHGNRRDDSKGSKLLYRDEHGMRIEDSAPYKVGNRKWRDSGPEREEEE